MLYRDDEKHNADSGHISAIKEQAKSAISNISTDSATSAKVNNLHKRRARTRLKVLPVRVTNIDTGSQQDVLAILDGGSDTHLISKRLYDELNLTGEPVQSRLCLADGKTLTSNTYETKKRFVD